MFPRWPTGSSRAFTADAERQLGMHHQVAQRHDERVDCDGEARAGPHARGIRRRGRDLGRATTLYWEGAPNDKHFHGVDDLYRRVVELDVTWHPPIDPKLPAFAVVYIEPGGHDHLSITAVVSTLLVVAGGVVAAFTYRRRRSSAARRVVDGLVPGHASRPRSTSCSATTRATGSASWSSRSRWCSRPGWSAHSFGGGERALHRRRR